MSVVCMYEDDCNGVEWSNGRGVYKYEDDCNRLVRVVEWWSCVCCV